MAEPRDYRKQRRNTYGEAPHASRSAIPRRRQGQHQALRRTVNAQLKAQGEDAEPKTVDRLAKVRGFQKAADEPLGRVLIADLCRRLVRGQLSLASFRAKMRSLRKSYPDFTAEFARVYYGYTFFPGAVPEDQSVRDALAEFA